VAEEWHDHGVEDLVDVFLVHRLVAHDLARGVLTQIDRDAGRSG
jgi:hypothetical protein